MKSVSLIERIAALSELLDSDLQEKLWEYAQLLYVEQVVFTNDTDPPSGEPTPHGSIAAVAISDGTGDFFPNGWGSTDSKQFVR